MARKPIHRNDLIDTQENEKVRIRNRKEAGFKSHESMSTSDESSNDEENVERSINTAEYSPKSSSIRTSPRTEKVSKTINNKTQAGGNVYVYGGIVLVLAFIAIITCTYSQKFVPEKRFCYFEKLQREYPKQKEIFWDTLSVGIESILNQRSQSPAVFLFTHHGGRTVHKLVSDVALHSTSCFGKSLQPVEMLSEDFKSKDAIDDYGYTIEQYKSKVKEENVILILNLDEIPAESAPALHTICDTVTPLVKNVVIFMTLKVPLTEEKPLQNAQNTLKKLWGDILQNYELDPLITRVTDQVIHLSNYHI